jgi:serine/threonine protein kinase
MERLRPDDPEQIGPWQIVNRLGSGGMGVVYMGTNGTRAAAVKVVRDFLLEESGSRARLAREVETLQKVKSNFVAEIVGSDISGKNAWIATNYVDGPSLKVLVDKEGPLSESQWFSFAHGLLTALAAIHHVNVTHRDVKPSNILMSKEGPKLIDFGIALSKDSTSLTKTGMVAGTPAWLAPEQFTGGAISSAVDIFAAGSTLFFAATGETPWGDDDSSVASIMHNLLTEEPNMEGLTEKQRNVLTTLLEKDPKQRPSAASALKELEKYAGQKLNADRSAQKKQKKKKLSTQQLSASLLVALLSVGALFYFISQSSSKKTTEYSWSILFEGEQDPQAGKSKSFMAFVCDQQVLTESLSVTGKSSQQDPQIFTTQVVPGDPRCGAEFDAVEVRGEIKGVDSSGDYVLSGSTLSGYDFSYGFNLSITQE